MNWFAVLFKSFEHTTFTPLTVMATTLFVGLGALYILQKSGVLQTVSGAGSARIVELLINKGFWLFLVAFVLCYLDSSGHHLIDTGKGTVMKSSSLNAKNVKANEPNAMLAKPDLQTPNKSGSTYYNSVTAGGDVVGGDKVVGAN